MLTSELANQQKTYTQKVAAPIDGLSSNLIRPQKQKQQQQRLIDGTMQNRK